MDQIRPPCFNIATGILAARLGTNIYDAAALLRSWYPDPTELHDYCAELIADLQARAKPAALSLTPGG